MKLAAPTPAERTALRLKPGDQVVRIHRIRVHNERPFAYEQISRIGSGQGSAPVHQR